MANIVIIGAGLGGVIAAYEIKDQLRDGDKITVVNKGRIYHFVPSNPWVAVKWRTRDAIEVDLTSVFKRRGIELEDGGAKRVHPENNQVELEDGRMLDYDYLVIATGPDLAFDEIEGFGPHGNTQSVCHVDHAIQAAEAFEEFCKDPGPIVIGAAQGASCYGPAYEFLMIVETELRKRKIRDKVPMTFVTSEPYIGHLGLDGVGDTKGLLESAMRNRHIKWMTSSKLLKAEEGKLTIEEINDDGSSKGIKEVASKFTMMLPAFRGVPCVFGIDKLTNPRGFIIVDKNQRNPTYQNIFAIGVCVAIAPQAPTPVPCGVPKTGFMIESMVTATAHNIGHLLNGRPANEEGTWNAVCLADFGDSGVAFVAQPQIPPRNRNWSSSGKWVHMAKIGFEKYFLNKIKSGESEPFYEKMVMDMLGITKLKD
ncbi:MAG: NAD(P)/FAD-dependent oxidoreductase [Caulobacterales bacterium]|nr:NAD(P)/FAD-dependent oxidoreductase [Caulobacterales bacterium]MCA0371502.1 NAD(P)/FAD-dependent oxidoreductase [Pseudomonadota bacterium]